MDFYLALIIDSGSALEMLPGNVPVARFIQFNPRSYRNAIRSRTEL